MTSNNPNPKAISPAVLPIHAYEPETAINFLLNHLQYMNLSKTLKAAPSASDLTYASNEDFWQGILTERNFATRIVNLNGFQVVDWYPRAPGLFFTKRAQREREFAEQYVHSNDGITIYKPTGKAHLMNGGIGSVRFRPIQPEQGDEFWLCTATSDGLCHTGVPLAIPTWLVEEVDFTGYHSYDLVGRLMFLPEILEGHFTHVIGVPQIYVFVESLLRTNDVLVEPTRLTPMVFFQVENLTEDVRKDNVTYVTCLAHKTYEIDNAIDWINSYVESYHGNVITDFDQQRRNFEGAIFSLQNVMTRHFQNERIQNFHIANIENATIDADVIQDVVAKTISTSAINVDVRKGGTVVMKSPKSNPWVSGSFYLAVAVVIIVALMVVAKQVDPLIFPIVLIGAIIIIGVIGALQLRNDEKLSQKNFLELMGLTYRQLPFIRGKQNKNT